VEDVWTHRTLPRKNPRCNFRARALPDVCYLISTSSTTTRSPPFSHLYHSVMGHSISHRGRGAAAQADLSSSSSGGYECGRPAPSPVSPPTEVVTGVGEGSRHPAPSHTPTRTRCGVAAAVRRLRGPQAGAARWRGGGRGREDGSGQ
jgi:hypothetical protein